MPSGAGPGGGFVFSTVGRNPAGPAGRRRFDSSRRRSPVGCDKEHAAAIGTTATATHTRRLRRGRDAALTVFERRLLMDVAPNRFRPDPRDAPPPAAGESRIEIRVGGASVRTCRATTRLAGEGGNTDAFEPNARRSSSRSLRNTVVNTTALRASPSTASRVLRWVVCHVAQCAADVASTVQRRANRGNQIVASHVFQDVSQRAGGETGLHQHRIGMHGHEHDARVRVVDAGSPSPPRCRRDEAWRCRRPSRRARGAPRRPPGRRRPRPTRSRRTPFRAACATARRSPRGLLRGALVGGSSCSGASGELSLPRPPAGERRTTCGEGPKNYGV